MCLSEKFACSRKKSSEVFIDLIFNIINCLSGTTTQDDLSDGNAAKGRCLP